MYFHFLYQIPFEVDPPIHKEYRSLVEPWFKRPLEAEYQEKLTRQINTLLDSVLDKDNLDAIEEFALVLQSRALTLLLNIRKKPTEVNLGIRHT